MVKFVEMRSSSKAYWFGSFSVTVGLSAVMVAAGVPALSFAAAASPKPEENGLAAEEQVEELAELIPDSAGNYLEADLNAIRQSASNTFEGIDIVGELTLGEPFVVCDVSTKFQDEVYEYPLVDNATGEVVLVASVIGTTEGWGYSISADMAKSLNEIDYLESPCIFYGEDGVVAADNSENEVSLDGESTPTMTLFAGMAFEDKVDAVEEQIENMQPVDVQRVQKESNLNVEDGYTPDIIGGTVAKNLVLHNNKGQGSDKLCWAATVATIVNYRKGSNITARNVADKMGKKYTEGGSIYLSQSALQKYGCKAYDYAKEHQISYQKTKTNIANKKPVYVSGTSTTNKKEGHAVTAYGYDCTDGAKLLRIWNSAPKGVGSYQVVKYKASGTVFKTNESQVYTWVRTLYAVDKSDSSL